MYSPLNTHIPFSRKVGNRIENKIFHSPFNPAAHEPGIDEQRLLIFF
jgi:hypothetical protein